VDFKKPELLDNVGLKLPVCFTSPHPQRRDPRNKFGYGLRKLEMSF
jgi:hypothetical protein